MLQRCTMSAVWCPGAGAVEAAAELLALADEQSLPHLRCVALDYIVAHHEAVSQTGGPHGARPSLLSSTPAFLSLHQTASVSTQQRKQRVREH